jgi:hypothetical protein
MTRNSNCATPQQPQKTIAIGRQVKKKARKAKPKSHPRKTSSLKVASDVSYSAPNSHLRQMGHEELMKLPVQQYSGTIVLVATSEDLARAAEDLRRQTVIGFDTETQPVFQKGQGQKPPSLVQLSSAHAVYLFQLRHNMVLPLLAELLAASNIVKAGVAVAGDIAGLKRIFPFVESNMVDIGLAALGQGMKQTGLRNLAAMLLGIRVCKGCRTSNWGSHMLSPQQIVYAATDAWVGRELYLDFQRRGFLLGTSHVAASLSRSVPNGV